MNNAPILGIKNNLGQFTQQLIQVFFVGLMIGMERNIIPVFAEESFGVARDSFILLTTFVMSFGFVKAAMNFVAGRMSERYGRRQVLLWGWAIALPIPFMLAYAPNWGWVVAANVLLGVNQGFAWSMTVTAKADIAHAHERGLATGFYEFAGYGGVAIAGIVTGYLSTEYGVRATLLEFGMGVVFLALISAYFFTKE
ncbi:MAG: MFS transporter, partial [Sphingomonadales bacterium]|nr:MFS transporter [Sphingomonadales bacterium]